MRKSSLICHTGKQTFYRGQIWVLVKHQGTKVNKLELYVMDSEGPARFGREWLHYIKLNWDEIQRMQ